MLKYSTASRSDNVPLQKEGRLHQRDASIRGNYGWRGGIVDIDSLNKRTSFDFSKDAYSKAFLGLK